MLFGPCVGGKCPYYSRALKKCKLGKANPTTEKRTLEVVELMGWSYICMRNPWKKEALFQISQKKGESEVASS